MGVDGDYVDRSALVMSSDKFLPFDLTQPLSLGRRFDIVSSLEVAEHLPPSAAETFVTSLTQHGDVVLFSAAIPGQPGTNHVNCQWPSYWANLFQERGYEVRDIVRPRIWTDGEIAPYYRQNMLVFVRGESLVDTDWRCEASRGPLDVVHPETYAERVLVPLHKIVEHRLRSHNVRTRLRARARRFTRR